MNLRSYDLLNHAKKHQANIYKEKELRRINKVQKYSLKRRVLVVIMAVGIYFSYILFQFLNL